MYKEYPKLLPEELIPYLRKSRSDDASLSVEEILSRHESIINDWVERNLGEPIPEENYYREVVSGETINSRPAFQEVLKRIESPNIKAVIVVECARLGRPDLEEIGRISKLFRYTNTLIITPQKTFDLRDEYDREAFEREMMRGNDYLEYTKKILSRGIKLSVSSGNYLGGKPPYGYDRITVTVNKRKCPTLAINEEEANIVRMMFDWYLKENIGTSTIANRLNELGLPSPKGKMWTDDSVRDILENIHYIGKVKWNTKKTCYVVEDGGFRKTRKEAPEEAIICDGKHEAIIPEEIFNAAQEKRGRDHKSCVGKQLRNPFATLIYCECGKAMSYRHSTRGNYKYRPPILVCNQQQLCGNGSIRVSEMMLFMVGVLKDKIAEFEIEAQNIDNNTVTIHEKMIATLEKKLADLNAQEVQMWKKQCDADESKHIPHNVFQVMTEELVADRNETIKALEKAREVVKTPIDYKKKIVTLQKALDALLDDNVSVADKNQLLKTCIERIDYKRDAPVRLLGKGVGKQWVMADAHIDVKFKV